MNTSRSSSHSVFLTSTSDTYICIERDTLIYINISRSSSYIYLHMYMYVYRYPCVYYHLSQLIALLFFHVYVWRI